MTYASHRLTLLAAGAALALSACGTSTQVPQNLSALGTKTSTVHPVPVQPVAVPMAPERVKMAEAEGGRGAWIIGSRGAWIKGTEASTVAGIGNTFTENLPEWDQIHLPQAHTLTPNLGAGVVVAVIDTGLDLDHPAFEGKLAGAGAWRDWVDGDRLPNDDGNYSDPTLMGYGHGTNVASIVAQVAPGAKILPLRVLRPDGSGAVADVVAAIDYAVSAGARVINLSVGTHNSSNVDHAVDRATAAGVYVVASSGNSGDQKVTAPARYATTTDTTGSLSLSVGSVNSQDVKSAFSTYGSKLEVLAPGEGIMGAAPEGMVEAWSGTSMAAPIASGLAALALGELPAGQRSKYTALLAQLMAETADSIDAVNDPHLAGALGRGRLNAEKFIRAVLR